MVLDGVCVRLLLPQVGWRTMADVKDILGLPRQGPGAVGGQDDKAKSARTSKAMKVPAGMSREVSEATRRQKETKGGKRDTRRRKGKRPRFEEKLRHDGYSTTEKLRKLTCVFSFDLFFYPKGFCLAGSYAPHHAFGSWGSDKEGKLKTQPLSLSQGV